MEGINGFLWEFMRTMLNDFMFWGFEINDVNGNARLMLKQLINFEKDSNISRVSVQTTSNFIPFLS